MTDRASETWAAGLVERSDLEQASTDQLYRLAKFLGFTQAAITRRTSWGLAHMIDRRIQTLRLRDRMPR